MACVLVVVGLAFHRARLEAPQPSLLLRDRHGRFLGVTGESGDGELGYWPPGQAFCIFFGRTPASRGDEIRPASPVNVVGRVVGDARVFKAVRAGTRIVIDRAI